MSPSIIVQKGPATTRVRSTTRIPSSGGMRHSSRRVSAINAQRYAGATNPRRATKTERCGATAVRQRRPGGPETTKARASAAGGLRGYGVARRRAAPSRSLADDVVERDDADEALRIGAMDDRDERAAAQDAQRRVNR